MTLEFPPASFFWAEAAPEGNVGVRASVFLASRAELDGAMPI
jgi:hypothetical protein